VNISGIVTNIRVDGYERTLTIHTGDRTIWCTYLQLDEYLDCGQTSEFLQVDERVNFGIILELVLEYELVTDSEVCGMIQDIHGSPHAVLTGRIVDRLAPDIYVMSLDESDRIEVHFELAVKLHIGDVIRAKGEVRMAASYE
jgi:hypothetical protein